MASAICNPFFFFPSNVAMSLLPGAILVTTAIDPGWTPLFPLLSGIVLETGGQLSHGAISAHEYGIPAVVNIPGAMHLIQDKQFIELDGGKGLVTLPGDSQDQ